jgi:selenide,water dikinase
MPIVDEPEIFGQIASVNAISDIYAMGGKPLMAIAILGWPVNTIPSSVARQVLEGSRQICAKAGIPLAGGHSIDCPEPVFGLAVTGLASINNIKRNDTAQPGDKLYVTTAQKRGLVKNKDLELAIQNMLTLNEIGFELGKLDYVNALTDVTGFGLLGHLKEICEGSKVSAQIDFDRVPVMPFIDEYLEMKCIPGGTNRNWESYGHKISSVTEKQKHILCDPQTSGGLLIAVTPEKDKEFQSFLVRNNLYLNSFGYLQGSDNQLITIN